MGIQIIHTEEEINQIIMVMVEKAKERFKENYSYTAHAWELQLHQEDESEILQVRLEVKICFIGKCKPCGNFIYTDSMFLFMTHGRLKKGEQDGLSNCSL